MTDISNFGPMGACEAKELEQDDTLIRKGVLHKQGTNKKDKYFPRSPVTKNIMFNFQMID